MTTNPEFFNVQPVQAALDTLFTQWQPQPRTETIDPRRALGRVLAETIHAPIDLPEFTRSTVDGYAVRAGDTFGASQTLPAYLRLVGKVVMGTAATIDIHSGETVEIHTGGMLPPGASAVVMIEHTQRLNEGEIEILAPVAPGENVIQSGEDVTQGDVILNAGQRVRPQDIGGMLAVGVLSIPCRVAPRIGILSCGDEIIPPEENPSPGQIRDINAHMLAALIAEIGAEPLLLGIARDELDDYQRLARAGFEQTNMLILTAGSSVSTRDLTRAVINGLGKPGVLIHGLAVKPGKPTILAICDNKPVIGLPGNPVSALLVARRIVLPIIRHMLGEEMPVVAPITAILTQNIPSTTGREDTIPVRLIEGGGTMTAEPIFGKSNLIFTLIHADGLIHIPLNSNGLRANSPVEVQRF
jgi:molybdopterin molybdotransferase